MICKKCRKETPDESVFCMMCGRKIQQAERVKRRPNGTGSVYKMAGVRAKPWRAVISEGRHRINVGCYATQTEALKALAAYEPAKSVANADITLREVYETWSQSRDADDYSESIRGNYSAAWNYLEKLHDRKIADLKAADYQEILDDLKSTHSRSSCEKLRSLVSHLCKWAKKNDIIQHNYAEFLTLPASKKKKEREFFTEDEIELLWNDGSFAAMVTLLMIYTGMRINELFNVKVTDVHLNEPLPNGRTVSYIIGGLKTEAGTDRAVVIHPRIMPIVKEWMSAEGRVFLVERGYTHASVNDDNFRKRDYYPMLERLGIPLIKPHKARHTFASRGAKAGVSAAAMKNLMGHKKYSTTVDIYTHIVDLEQLADAIEMIEKDAPLLAKSTKTN